MGLFGKKKKDEDAGAPPTLDPDKMRADAADISARMHKNPMSLRNIKDLTKMAVEMRSEGMAMAQRVQQVQSEGGTVGSLLSALGIDWSSDYIKRVDCPSCGGPKKLPSPSAYLYCDYCGALADFDFRTACADQSLKMPGPEYVALTRNNQPRLDAALAANDRNAYEQAQRELFDAYATNVPKACSHRVSDPDYKAKWVDYMASNGWVLAVDPQYKAMNEEMTNAVRGMQWTGGFTDRKTGGPTFWALVDVVQRQRVRAKELTRDMGLQDLDPDHASDEVRERMASSLFCQGWLPMLEGDDAQRLIEEMHLKGEYSKIEPIADGETTACGGCGGELTVVKGAKRVICDHCGRALDVGGALSTCQGCGGHLTFPVGVSHLQCPFCRADNERVGLT